MVRRPRVPRRPTWKRGLWDEAIVLTSPKKPDRPKRRRQIKVWLEERQRMIVFVTNHLQLAARTLAAVYRDLWYIKLFFKAITRRSE